MRYLKLFLVLFFLVSNYVAIRVAVGLLNRSNDSAVVLGIFLLAFTALSDVDIVRTYFKRREKNEVVSKSN